MIKKAILLVCVPVLVLALVANAQPPGVSATVTGGGGGGGGSIIADQPFQFDIHINNTQAQAITGIQHGFHVYSPDGASWQPIVGDTFSIGWPPLFDAGAFFLKYAGVTGSGADSVEFGALAIFGPGLASGFNGDCYLIATQVYAADIGLTVCLDSAWLPPAGDWVWGMQGGGGVNPAWAGPYCYTIDTQSTVWDHKMHFPQLPDEAGWDVNATQPLVLADDFMCMETGWIKDIHWWGSWRHGEEGQILYFVLSLHEDIPADQNPDGYSKPGITLWESEVGIFDVTPLDPPSMEGWLDPYRGDTIWNDHQAYFRYDVILPQSEWYPQDSGTIYWLNISAVLEDTINYQWGWKSTQDRWNDDAVWALWGDLDWMEMYEPGEPVDTLTNDFYITLFLGGAFITGGGTGFYGDGWYYYPDTDWWNIWFYDHPLDYDRWKEVQLEFDMRIYLAGFPSNVEIAVNWATDTWTNEGNSDPPLPGVQPESDYIGRAIVYSGPVPDVTTHFTFPFELWEYNPEWVSVDVRGENFQITDGVITHICAPREEEQSLNLSFVITGDDGGLDTCDYYKSPYLDYVPQGMPDFDMKQLAAWTGDGGRWTHDGPAALANCIWWFDSKFETGMVDPRPFWPGPGNPPLSDSYPLLSTYDPALQWDDHDTNNVQPFIDDLANNYLNTGALGTYPMDMINGFRTYINTLGMDPDYRDSAEAGPSYEFIRDEVLTSQDVILLLGFYEDLGTGYSNYLGGHWVTTAGICTHDRIICISDPYLDALEGEPPAGGAHGPTDHNDADNISGPHSQIQHDPYTCTSTIPPGWTAPVEVINYPTTMAIINQFNGMNAMSDPGAYGGGPLFVVIDMAYVICPDTVIDTCEYYKPPYDDYSPYGMPDFDQKQDMWIYPPSGMWSYCGPVALANCFWWFDSKFEPSPQDPNPFYPDPAHSANDGYNLVYSFDPGGVWDDHDTNNVMPFVDSMALYCLTNSSGSGTNVFDLAQGAQDWIDSVGLSGKYTVNVMPVDAAFGFDQIREEVLISQDVILLLGFYEDFGSNCERVGGHFVTVAGTCTDPLDSALCISDPYFDMHEGEPPAGSAHGSSVHNDAANISGPHGTMHHDKYWVTPNTCPLITPPFFDCELPGYPVNAGNVPVWYGQNNPDPSIDPVPPQGGPIHTIIEYAVIICPDTTPPPTGACCEPPYGLCHIMTQFSCDSAGWFYEGDGTTCTPNPCDSCDYQSPGDVDNDGNINVADIAYLISFLYKGGPAPPVMANADPNGDCCIDYRDVLYLIQFVFFAGPPPVNCTCVDPPVCIPAPGTYVPGIVKHNTDGYLPTDGSPIGTNWHELFPGYCENWTCSSWVDNGDGILSYCDTLDFYHPVYGVKTLEHVELVTPTIELINTVDPFDTLYLDLIDPPNATCTTITEPIGTRWHEVYPQYCHQFMIVYHGGLNFMSPLAVSDMIIIQSLNGADSGTSYETYMVTDIDCDIVTTPLITLGDEYDHNVDGYSPYSGSPEGSLWQELYPNFDEMWIVDKWIDNGDGWLSFCDTIKVVGQDPPYPVRWKHVKELTYTLTCTDPANDTFYFDYRMVNPMYPWSSAPVGTFWHELYPTFSQMTWCINWIDNGTGFVDFCDSLDLEYLSGPDSGTVVRFHVESIDWDMVSTIEEYWNPPPPMDGKFKHNIDGWHLSDANPEGSLWHELWFNYCETWRCSLWIDNGNMVLDYCDTLVFRHEPTGRLSYEHVQVVTPTITITKADTTWYLDGLDPNPLIYPVTAPVGGYWQLVYPRNSWFGLPYQITAWNDNGNGFLDSCDYIDFRDEWGNVHSDWHVVAFETDIITDPLPNPNVDEYDHNLDGYFPADGDPTGTYWHELYPNYCDLWQIEEWRDNGDDVLSFCDTLKFRGEIMEDSVLWKHVEEVTGTLVLVPEEAGDTTYMDMMCGRPTAEPLTMAEGPLGTIFHEVYPTFCRRFLWQGWGDNGNGVLDAGDQVAMRSILPPDSGTVHLFIVVDWQTDIMTTIIPAPSCCMPPIRGNVDYDALDAIDISDLVYLVDYMFTGGPAPVCFEEADMDCSGGILDIADLVYLVDYMFNQGPAPCRCDCSDCP